MVSPTERVAIPREVDHVFSSGIIVAVGAVIFNAAAEVLLVKHVPDRRGYWQGRWICPGGRLTRGESILNGTLREVLEETGLAIRPRHQLPPFERIVRVDGEPCLHVVYIDYVADMVGGDLTPASDIGEALWVPPTAIDTVWADCHEDTRRLLTLAGIQPNASEVTAI